MKHLTLATIYKQPDYIKPISHIGSQKCSLDSSHTYPRPHRPPIDDTDKPQVAIDNAPVDFLLDIIDKQCEFKVLSEHVWQLRYFIEGPYEQILYVSFASCTADHPDILGYLPEQCDKHITEFITEPQKLVKAAFIETHQYQPTNAVIHNASYLVRNTSSLVFDTLTQHSDRFVHVDGRGSVLLTPNCEHVHTFHMQVILLALAKAYLLATSAIVSELGECCEDFTPLRQLYQQAVTFNAKSYFVCPVKVNRYDAYTLWQDIRKTMPIDDINNEIVQQVQSIHRLLVEQEEALERQTELKISKRLGWMGVGIGTLSLVSVFEITPQKVTEFLGSWWGILF